MKKTFSPHFQPSAHLYRLLEDISAHKERIQNSLVKVPWVPSLVVDARARLAWGSTAIEGCTLSLEAVQGLLEGKEAIGYPDRHVKMAQNYLKALAWIQKRDKVTNMSESDIFKLHKIIAHEAVDEGHIGAYRKESVSAGLHVAPRWQDVKGLMHALLEWLNGPAKAFPAVFSSSILHLRFVEIHPFRDGNGRVARALAVWELYRKGFDNLHVFALDEVLLENRALYIKALQRVQIEGADLGGWLEFMAEAVLETLRRVEQRIISIGPIAMKPIALTVRQEKLLRVLREKGSMSIGEIAKTLKITAPGSHHVMKPLLKHGLISRIGAHRATRYVLSSSVHKGASAGISIDEKAEYFRP
ncbi:MAG: Fic family protein [Pseudomonadota bacterium]